MFWQYLIPKATLTLLAGKLAECRKTWLKNYLIKAFIKAYHVDLNEAIYSNPELYETFNQFFTRQLQPGCRPFSQASNQIICPVDGYLSEFGQMQESTLIQAKKRLYTLDELLANQADRIAQFKDGLYATLYLAPHNYHRVHLPTNGRLSQIVYVPGELFSVNTGSAEGIPKLFARNERVILYFETSLGTMAVILVGAMIVGNIVTPWTGSVTPLRKKGNIHYWNYISETILCLKGDDIGQFQLGSTVILLFTRGAINWLPELQVTQTLRMGQTLATCKFAKQLFETHEQDIVQIKE